jgi:hypothetical protein
MTYVPRLLRSLVQHRAGNRCEYCRLAQKGQATFHIDHIVPGAQGGLTEAENLALSCISCSLRKGDRSRGFDPQTGQETMLFHPRKMQWHEHFECRKAMIRGLTPEGRTTVVVLRLNHPRLVGIRKDQIILGRFPPT